MRIVVSLLTLPYFLSCLFPLKEMGVRVLEPKNTLTRQKAQAQKWTLKATFMNSVESLTAAGPQSMDICQSSVDQKVQKSDLLISHPAMQRNRLL